MSTATMDATSGLEPAKGHMLKIVRTFDAPRELVWRAISETDMAMRWAGPRGFRAKEMVLPTKVGETWSMTMIGKVPATQDDVELKQHGTVLEIDPPRKLVYTFAWNQRGCVGLDDSPFPENTVSFELEEKGKKTVMTFIQGPFATEGECQGHTGGWNSAFDKFAEFLLAEQPGHIEDPNMVSRELHLKRVFAAPREMVFKAWTDPKMLTEWWGPKHFTSTVHAWEPQNGGAIHVVMHGPDGVDYPMSGKFFEVYPPYRLHFTAGALDQDGKMIFENWNSVFLEEVEGGTQVTLDVHVTNETGEAERYLRGMREGWSLSLDKLDAFLTQKVA